MTPSLIAADQDLAAAAQSALVPDRTAAANSLAQAGKEIAALRDQGFCARAARKARLRFGNSTASREKIDAALADDVALPVDTQANRHELVAGETFTVNVNFLDKPAAPVKWTVDKSSLLLPQGWTREARRRRSQRRQSYHFTVSIPAGAQAAEFTGRCGAAISSRRW